MPAFKKKPKFMKLGCMRNTFYEHSTNKWIISKNISWQQDAWKTLVWNEDSNIFVMSNQSQHATHGSLWLDEDI